MVFDSIQADEIVDTLRISARRVLLFGPPGVGKSTLAARLAQALATRDRPCRCLSADPGSPAFGVPGAVSLAEWQAGQWGVIAMRALCSLDAGRFRLPLVMAVQQLARPFPEGMLLLDGPGVVRGMAGRELLSGLVQAAAVDAVLVLSAADRVPPLPAELEALGVELFWVQAAADAHRPGKMTRAKRRTQQWDTYLADSRLQSIRLEGRNLVGTPPPLTEPDAWVGRQVALLAGHNTLAMGEVQQLLGQVLLTRLAGEIADFESVLVRDALRSPAGVVETATPFVNERLVYLPAPEMTPSPAESGGPRVAGRVGTVDVALINGVFGDPLLHLRLRHRRRSLLFDLGEGARLSARLAHQVSDVFISHAHLDHIGGFVWLLRSRIGEFPPCRLYGPPGLAGHITGFLRAILWDRVGTRGPCFEVTEIHADRLDCFRLQAGRDNVEPLTSMPLLDGVLLAEREFQVRAAMLDHQGIPVMAYAYQPARQINIRKDRLLQHGLAPGPWLTQLKQHLLAGEESALIRLPDGKEQTAAALGAELALIRPGKKLVYATDLADSAENRARLVALAQNAHTLFCEATFLQAEAEQAARTGHLTTHACGKIAMAATVARLVPFHFSHRYADNPQPLYDEISQVCDRLVLPDLAGVMD